MKKLYWELWVNEKLYWELLVNKKALLKTIKALLWALSQWKSSTGSTELWVNEKALLGTLSKRKSYTGNF